jgi:hypothetical protein
VQPIRESDARFHWNGVMFLVVAIVAYYAALVFALLVTSSTCNDGPGNPMGQSSAFMVLSALLIGFPAFWARRAWRQERSWVPWLAVLPVTVLVVVGSIHWGAHPTDVCLF